MNPLRLTVTRKLTLKLYSDYHSRDFRNWAQKFPFVRIFLIFALIAALGFFMHYDILLYMVAFGGGALIIYLGYFFLRYKLAIGLWKRQVAKQLPEVSVFDFWFTEEGIFKAYEDVEVKESWEDLGFYEELDGLVYLFRKDLELYDIISDQILEKKIFIEFSALVRDKLQYRTKSKKPEPKTKNPETITSRDSLNMFWLLCPL